MSTTRFCVGWPTSSRLPDTDRLSEPQVAIVGAFVRIDRRNRAAIRYRLGMIEGVETFELRDPGTIGLLVECDGLVSAHRVLRDIVPRVDGVLGFWPVYVEVDADERSAGSA